MTVREAAPGVARSGRGVVSSHRGSFARSRRSTRTMPATRGVTGDVVLEIVIKSDGSVGDVKVLRGLGSGLDERAVTAVRNWRFAPARRLGSPVDVIVEVEVEFSLR